MMEYTLLTESSGGIFSNPLFLILFYVVVLGGLWFILMRPQKKEQKRQQAMLSSMEIGDAVVTSSGFYGVIIDITEEDVIVEFGNNKNCRIPMRKAAIIQVEKPEDAAAVPEKDTKSTDKKEK